MDLKMFFARLLVFGLFSRRCACNDSFFSKFNQHAYKIKDVLGEIATVNQDVMNFARVVTFKYNRTIPAVINMTFNFKVDAEDKLEVLAQMYKFGSNEYRPFPVHFQVNVKKSFVANVGGTQSLKNCGNVTDAYFLKDITYHMCNFYPDETKLPPLIPSGRYKLEQTLLYLNQIAFKANYYGEVYIPVKIPSKKTS